MQTFTGNNSKAKPWGFSKLVEPLEVVHRTWHVKAAVRRCAARARRETRGTARDARSTDGRVRDPRETRARRVPRAFVSRCARARRAEPTADFAEPVKRAIFPAAKSRMRGRGRTVASNARVGSGVISGVILADFARRASAAVQSRARRATKCPANARRDPVCRECALYAQTDSAARGGSRPFTRTSRVRGSRRVLVEREVSRVSTD